MARWYGEVGFAETIETAPGVFQETISPHEYVGDVMRNSASYKKPDKVNEDIDVNLSIEIVADPFAYKNFMHIRYVEWMGNKWKVNSVDAANYPRLKLSIGGLYEG